MLIVAGSDSSGGAGIARDVATATRFGVGAALAVTAITAQTHAAVIAVEPVPASLVATQMWAALAAGPIGAVKVGMLATAETVQAVVDVLAGIPAVAVVVDPVLASSSGARLLSEPGIERLRQALLPAALLITPNLLELAILAGSDVARSDGEIARQAARLLGMGCPNVLVKGGHADGTLSIDTLFAPGTPPRRFASRRRDATLRGTGCMLSSAIAAHLALGHDMAAALSAAKAYLDDMFAAAVGGRQT
ncbi:hydroxymethylpyrimidine/phosphomethylpyrimidine kinase [Mycoplana dimorpha]|uniref:hydroxymethylpyrimidine kinase n=1 Tax=Mycoplana dimorpha TaxID=28320 RepID=A0A2T5B3G8_MYCDI|nr:hydroxymethylpyrimidine/phosphomethylpyrimidine kinase [Mycoplana dimorpha]PTM93527.1 hydroxymethylpyrimidine kinase /phosphomethylpyrimidine kinase [Mycoplana dimorpha]